jgi:hypothetical protein
VKQIQQVNRPKVELVAVLKVELVTSRHLLNIFATDQYSPTELVPL